MSYVSVVFLCQDISQNSARNQENKNECLNDTDAVFLVGLV